MCVICILNIVNAKNEVKICFGFGYGRFFFIDSTIFE